MESKTYVFGNEGSTSNNGMLGLLAPLLQKQGVDPNVLLAMKVRRHLRDLGCAGIPLEDACNLVLEGEANKGITYSNVDIRKTVVVIGWTTSKAEYMNSLSHEMLHVVQHISEQFLINMYGEEACYLLGGLVQACCIRKG